MNITYQGDLLRRLLKNKERLTSDIYTYPGIFKVESSWPGDHQGRALLGLCSLYESLKDYNEYEKEILAIIKEIFNHLAENTNQYHYFGNPYDGIMVDEQQISGNSWYLRALVNYYRITNDERGINYIHGIIENFLLPISKHYKRYSTKKRSIGGVGGHIVESAEDGWSYSSDIGCAFIMLDGMTAAYELVPSVELKSIIESLIEQFVSLDYVNLEFQTHATLSCTRGILRFYNSTKEEKYLNYAIEIFENYLSKGRTLDYSNYNWFRREDTWTEPCSIVDSFIVAKELFNITHEEKYLQISNRIYLNAFRIMQRDNGGAGCSTCLRHDDLEMRTFLYEAWFCCSMRLGEGLKEVSSFILEEKDRIILPIFHEGRYQIDCGFFEILGDIYEKEDIKITVSNITKPIFIYLNSDIIVNGTGLSRNNNYLVVEPNASDIHFTVQYNYHREGDCLFAGDMLLIKATNAEQVTLFEIDGEKYGRVVDYSKVIGEKNAKKVIQKL